jgi:hypothetical protein
MKIMAKLPYGYEINPNGEIAIKGNESEVVRQIFQNYLSGDSLGQITDVLHDKRIATPTGKERWTATTIDKMLLNAKYIPIVGMEQYFEAQFELDRRSRTDPDTGKRKTARYSSSNVLSGLLVCSECGRSYRRVQRASGEIVWRCANRVEHGCEICKNSPTVTESDYLTFICDTLCVEEIVPQMVKATL